MSNANAGVEEGKKDPAAVLGVEEKYFAIYVKYTLLSQFSKSDETNSQYVLIIIIHAHAVKIYS